MRCLCGARNCRGFIGGSGEGALAPGAVEDAADCSADPEPIMVEEREAAADPLLLAILEAEVGLAASAWDATVRQRRAPRRRAKPCRPARTALMRRFESGREGEVARLRFKMLQTDWSRAQLASLCRKRECVTAPHAAAALSPCSLTAVGAAHAAWPRSRPQQHGGEGELLVRVPCAQDVRRPDARVACWQLDKHADLGSAQREQGACANAARARRLSQLAAKRGVALEWASSASSGDQGAPAGDGAGDSGADDSDAERLSISSDDDEAPAPRPRSAGAAPAPGSGSPGRRGTGDSGGSAGRVTSQARRDSGSAPVRARMTP